MRESIGGTWLFGIVALFIVLFSGFMAYSISYTKAFNTKNEIINLIERNEGFTFSTDVAGNVTNMSDNQLQNDKSTEAQAYLFIKSGGYNSSEVDCSRLDHGEYIAGGYCLQRHCSDATQGTDSKVYYKVTTYIKVKIPVINIQVNIPVSGETKAMYYENPRVDTNRLKCIRKIFD